MNILKNNSEPRKRSANIMLIARFCLICPVVTATIAFLLKKILPPGYINHDILKGCLTETSQYSPDDIYVMVTMGALHLSAIMNIGEYKIYPLRTPSKSNAVIRKNRQIADILALWSAALALTFFASLPTWASALFFAAFIYLNIAQAIWNNSKSKKWQMVSTIFGRFTPLAIWIIWTVAIALIGRYPQILPFNILSTTLVSYFTLAFYENAIWHHET